MIRLCACIFLICFLTACATEKKKHKVVDMTEEVYRKIKKNSDTKKFKQLREALLKKTTDEDLKNYRDWLEK